MHQGPAFVDPGVGQLGAGFQAVEEGGRQGQEALGREPVGDVPHVGRDPENLLEDQQPGFGGAGGRGQVAVQGVTIQGFDLYDFTGHRSNYLL